MQLINWRELPPVEKNRAHVGQQTAPPASLIGDFSVEGCNSLLREHQMSQFRAAAQVQGLPVGQREFRSGVLAGYTAQPRF